MKIDFAGLTVLCAALASCSEKSPAAPARAESAEAADTEVAATALEGDAKAPDATTRSLQEAVERLKQANAAKDAARLTAVAAVRTTVDANGFDWVKHAGNIPFALEPVSAMERAKAAGRPMMLYFAAQDCGVCVKLGQDAFKDAAFVKSSAYFVPVLVDVDVHTELKEKYGVVQTPFVVYAEPDGTSMWTTDDYQPVLVATKDMTDAIAELEKQKSSPGDAK